MVKSAIINPMGRLKSETKEEYNARMNRYMKKKYFERRAKAIEYLGGQCIDCFSTELLEFDHTRDKEFNIAHKLNSAPRERILRELDKCVLRCMPCHSHITASRKLQDIDVLGTLMGR